MLATIFRRKESIVALALKTFQDFGMIEIIDGVITIPNWGKHQKLDQFENRKEYMRDYMKEYREKQKQLVASAGNKVNDDVNSKPNSKPNSKRGVNSLDKNREDKNREEVEGDKSRALTVPNGTVCRTKDVRWGRKCWR